MLLTCQLGLIMCDAILLAAVMSAEVLAVGSAKRRVDGKCIVHGSSKYGHQGRAWA